MESASITWPGPSSQPCETPLWQHCYECTPLWGEAEQGEAEQARIHNMEHVYGWASGRASSLC